MQSQAWSEGCSHTGPALPRPALQASAAAREGRECLFELLTAAQEMAAEAHARTAGAPGRAKGPSGRSCSGAAGPEQEEVCAQARGLRLVLLRLDHMRDRKGYCR